MVLKTAKGRSLLQELPVSQVTPPALPRLQSLPILLSGAVVVLGLVVMSGWLLEVREMVEFRAGLVAMVFNTALCFTLAGSA